jgi:nucleoid DNA-binding protein
MSTPATSFRLFYPESNTLTAAGFHNALGEPLTPSNFVDGPTAEGFKSKDITFASAVEPLLATPTLTDPLLPVSLYLCRNDAGVFTKVIDETVFVPATPARPTPRNDKSQFLLYTATDLGGGIKTYAVKAPVAPVSIIKDAGKDEITGENLDGNTILFRWTGPVPTTIEVEADVEDITDPLGYFPVPVSNITTYSESSVGLSLVKAESQVVPRDGMGHAVNFRVRYNVNGDTGVWVDILNSFITYQLEAPNPPTALTVTLLRDRIDTIPDVLKLEWARDAGSPGTGVVIYATDYLNKKHTIYTSNGPETECRVENVSRFIVQETGPAVARPYVLSIAASNISDKSAEKQAAAPINITSKLKPVDPPTPDEIAGTAREVGYATLKAEVFADVMTQLGSLPAEGQNIVSNAVDALVFKIKDVVAKGGSVELNDFGVMAAKWTKDRMARNPSNGEPVVVPAYRNLGFTPSIGFKTGVKTGAVMTDLQAKPAT